MDKLHITIEIPVPSFIAFKRAIDAIDGLSIVTKIMSETNTYIITVEGYDVMYFYRLGSYYQRNKDAL